VTPIVNQEASYLGPLRPLYDLWGTFLSPSRGLLILSPFLLMLIPGLRAGWRVAPDWVRASAVGGLGYLIMQLSGNRFTGGLGYFGYRVTMEPLVLCTPLLALAFQHWTAVVKWRLQAFSVLAVASLWTFSWGAVFYTLQIGKEFSPWSYDFAVPWQQKQGGQLVISLAMALSIAFVVRWVWRQPGAREMHQKASV
jgi:hypothetical protein